VRTINAYYKNQVEFADFVQEHRETLFSQENTAMLVQVFCGRNNLAYIKQLVNEISHELPQAHVVGATTAGEIVNGEVCGLETVVAMTVFQYTDIRVKSFDKEDQDDFILGRHIATTLATRESNVLILLGSGELVNQSQVLKGIEVENPQLFVAGGSAGKSNKVHPSMVFYGQEIIENGFVGIILEGKALEARLYSHLGWQGIGKEMTITQVDGNRVYTINNLPAYQVYRRYLGIDKLYNFLNVVEFPLLINRDGVLMARTPMICYDDDSIGFAGDFLQGDIVRLSFGDAGLISDMVKQLCQEIQQEEAESIFVYSCESRRGFLQELSNIETKPLQKIAPTIGFFTSGEYYHARGRNHLMNATMTVLVLAEQKEKLRNRGDLLHRKKTYFDLYCPIYRDSVAERSKGVLKTLTHLIQTVTAELETANHNLHYIGLHDSLTGTYNRTFFDQQMKYLENIDDTVGIIICDMDCLKLINDTLGHEFGDKIIKLFASVLEKSCRKDDVVARIGGDEFAILVQGATKDDFARICSRIENCAQKLRTQDETNLLYLSIGAMQREKGSQQKVSEIFTAADNAMYQHKLKKKENVRNAVIYGRAQMSDHVVDTR